MHSFAILVSCFVLGMLLRRSARMPETAAASLNGFIVHISLPALTLHTLRHLSLEASLAAPLVMAWLLFAAGTGFFFLAQRAFGWGAPTTGALILTGALGNTSFVGLPMIECFFGREHLAVGILIDQLGTYVVLSTVGLLLAATLSAGELTLRAVARRILGFPPFLAVLLAFATAPLALPQWTETTLARLGDTLAPLALFSVGYQLRLGALRSRWRPLAAGLGYKLVAGPLLVLAVFGTVWGLDGPATRIAVFEAAMAPMIGGAIVAVEHKLDAEIATLMVGIGIPLSFLTVPVWSMVLTA
jgi:predicted permease